MNTDDTIYDIIKSLSDKFETKLHSQMALRTEEMKSDDNSHHALYRALGVASLEGFNIDLYQNKGRFLYNYAGSFLEQAAKLCIQHKYPTAATTKIPNTLSARPTKFEIDALTPTGDAFEIKWRDATTDGDHIAKEHTRLRAIADAGYHPIRIMFYYPNREQAKRVQCSLEALYGDVGGEYHHGDAAWRFMENYTGVDLHAIVDGIAQAKNLN